MVCIDNSILLINIIKTLKARSDANECVLFYNVCIPYFIVSYLSVFYKYNSTKHYYVRIIITTDGIRLYILCKLDNIITSFI